MKYGSRILVLEDGRFGFTLDLVTSFPDTDHRLIVATYHQSEGELMRTDPLGYNTLIKLRQFHADRVKIMFEINPSELPKDKLRDFHFTDIVFNLLPNPDGTGRGMVGLWYCHPLYILPFIRLEVESQAAPIVVPRCRIHHRGWSFAPVSHPPPQ